MQLDLILYLLRRWYAHTLVLACLLAGCSGSAQTAPPALRMPRTQRFHAVADHLYPYAGIFLGYGSSVAPTETRATGSLGAGLGFGPRHLPIFTEVGVIGPQANRGGSGSTYVSADVSVPLTRSGLRATLLALVGYSHLFQAGDTFDYGLALVLPRPWKPKDDMRIELRDYWAFTDATQHNVMLRVGLITFAPN